MVRFLALIGVAALATGAPQPSAVFEVASVKVAADPGRLEIYCAVPCVSGERLTVTGATVDIRYMSLQKLITTAYRIKDYQLSGPEWMRTQRFDIAAKIPAGVSKDRLPEMLQALLADRFKLTIHRQTKELPVYALVVGKNGAKLQAPPPDADKPVPDTPGSQVLNSPHGEGRLSDNGDFALSGGVYGPLRGGRIPGGGMRTEFLKLTMPALVEVLAPHVDRPVVDRTNLTGGYHLVCEIRPPEGAVGRKGTAPSEGNAPVPSDAYGEALFAAIEKGGLKLEKSKAQMETILVDRLEKIPTGN